MKAVYILSHCPHMEPFTITDGKHNIIPYITNFSVLFFVIKYTIFDEQYAQIKSNIIDTIFIGINGLHFSNEINVSIII